MLPRRVSMIAQRVLIRVEAHAIARRPGAARSELISASAWSSALFLRSNGAAGRRVGRLGITSAKMRLYASHGFCIAGTHARGRRPQRLRVGVAVDDAHGELQRLELRLAADRLRDLLIDRRAAGVAFVRPSRCRSTCAARRGDGRRRPDLGRATSMFRLFMHRDLRLGTASQRLEDRPERGGARRRGAVRRSTCPPARGRAIERVWERHGCARCYRAAAAPRHPRRPGLRATRVAKSAIDRPSRPPTPPACSSRTRRSA